MKTGNWIKVLLRKFWYLEWESGSVSEKMLHEMRYSFSSPRFCNSSSWKNAPEPSSTWRPHTGYPWNPNRTNSKRRPASRIVDVLRFSYWWWESKSEKLYNSNSFNKQFKDCTLNCAISSTSCLSSYCRKCFSKCIWYKGEGRWEVKKIKEVKYMVMEGV